MSRTPRKQSEANIYHVFARGSGRMLIFEDDEDRIFFLNALGALLVDFEGSLLAWTLMGNHFHMLIRMPLDALSRLMKRLLTAYAQRFNKRHGHVGHVFQGRFGSQPIESDEQLMACVRYIHRNPVESRICKTCDYKWSSYRGYIQGAAVTDTAFVLEVFGGVEPFIRFHQSWDDGRYEFIDVDKPVLKGYAKRLSDAQANDLAVSLLSEGWREKLPSLPKPERDECLRKLKEAGLSALQIERLTGIGRNIINRS